MTVSQLMARTALLGFAVLAVVATMWLWRDMRSRGRPPWLRVLVILLSVLPPSLGMLVCLVDLVRHPHDPGLSIRETFRRSWQGRLRAGLPSEHRHQ